MNERTACGGAHRLRGRAELVGTTVLTGLPCLERLDEQLQRPGWPLCGHSEAGDHSEGRWSIGLASGLNPGMRRGARNLPVVTGLDARTWWLPLTCSAAHRSSAGMLAPGSSCWLSKAEFRLNPALHLVCAPEGVQQVLGPMTSPKPGESIGHSSKDVPGGKILGYTVRFSGSEQGDWMRNQRK